MVFLTELQFESLSGEEFDEFMGTVPMVEIDCFLSSSDSDPAGDDGAGMVTVINCQFRHIQHCAHCAAFNERYQAYEIDSQGNPLDESEY